MSKTTALESYGVVTIGIGDRTAHEGVDKCRVLKCPGDPELRDRVASSKDLESVKILPNRINIYETVWLMDILRSSGANMGGITKDGRLNRKEVAVVKSCDEEALTKSQKIEHVRF